MKTVQRVALFLLASLSIASLLIYFFGLARFRTVALAFLTIEIAGLIWLARHRPARHIIISGLWAGLMATLAYDIVRVPLVHSGLPIFKAISYFGTVFAGSQQTSAGTEAIGWLYHLSNGLSFALMYLALPWKPRWWTAVLWGLLLELVMLLTPYAEVFGYQRSGQFLAITIGAHVAYGLGLWIAVRYFETLNTRAIVGSALIALVGLGWIASDFRELHAHRLKTSPPPYVGPHLYTIWDVPEPDRVCATWILKRYVDPDAEFLIIRPFEKVQFGTPFDMPEAGVRRRGLQSATEYLIDSSKIQTSPQIAALARMTNLSEVSPWMLSSDPAAAELAQRIREAARSTCGETLSTACLAPLLSKIDDLK